MFVSIKIIKYFSFPFRCFALHFSLIFHLKMWINWWIQTPISETIIIFNTLLYWIIITVVVFQCPLFSNHSHKMFMSRTNHSQWRLQNHIFHTLYDSRYGFRSWVLVYRNQFYYMIQFEISGFLREVHRGQKYPYPDRNEPYRAEIIIHFIQKQLFLIPKTSVYI